MIFFFLIFRIMLSLCYNIFWNVRRSVTRGRTSRVRIYALDFIFQSRFNYII